MTARYSHLGENALQAAVKRLDSTLQAPAKVTTLVKRDNEKTLASCNQWGYNMRMIKSFRHKGLSAFYSTGSKTGIQAKHADRLRLILARLDAAHEPKDMNLPGLGLHKLSSNLKSFRAVSVSGNWRVIFRFEGQDAFDVNYLDYH